MHDSLIVKDYLKSHGVDNVLDLNYEELQEEYTRVVHEGVKYYHELLQDGSTEIIDFEIEHNKHDVITKLKKIETTNELYEFLYDYSHTYTQTDLVALLGGIKAPILVSIPYVKLQKMVAIVHARIQDEILDSIKSDLESLPIQEKETLITHYESMRDDIFALEKLHAQHKSSGTLKYLQTIAEVKLDIIQTFMNKELETEYKPFYDNSKEKQTLVSKILEISGIYTRQELFDMKIAELQKTYDEIMEQVIQKEKEQKLMRKYIEIFEDSAGITESEFKFHCQEMQTNLPEDIIHEIITYFTTHNHFIANKINNVLSGKSMNKQKSPAALLAEMNQVD